MKKMVALAMMLCMLVCAAGMATAEAYHVWVGGKQFTSDQLVISGGSGTASYDPAAKKLTLNNYTYSGPGYGYSSVRDSHAVIYAAGDLQINLVGSSALINTVEKVVGPMADGYGIAVNGGSLTIGGNGSLNIAAQDFGIFTKKDMVISGGSVNAAGEVGMLSYGKMRISGENTRVYSATIDEEAGGAIDSICGMTIDSPLEILLPEGGTLNAYGWLVDRDGKEPSEVLIAALKAESELPQTGDRSSMALWFALLAMAGAGMIALRRNAAKQG